MKLSNNNHRIIHFSNSFYVSGIFFNLFSSSEFAWDYGSGILSKNEIKVAHIYNDSLSVVQLAEGPNTIYPPNTPQEQKVAIMASGWVTENPKVINGCLNLMVNLTVNKSYAEYIYTKSSFRLPLVQFPSLYIGL